jgi:lipoyl(octanoyl) transferase
LIFPAAQWRLILSPPAKGAWNMAVDEAILEAVCQGKSLPTLRLYAWDPPCLSLGYRQPFADVDQERLGLSGWELVRRPTGGKAILHTDELTYSVCGPASEPRLKGGVIESYRRVSQALLQALREMGLAAEANSEAATLASGEVEGPVCFEVPSNYEIVVNRKKLIGSAQSRRNEGVLQHGSLPLTGDLRRITEVLVFEDEAARQEAGRRLLERATTVSEALGQTIAWETAAHAFAEAFAEVLNIEFAREEISPPEIRRAEELVDIKFGAVGWTAKI